MYKTLWFKVHLILGLVFGAILLLVAFSGAMLSYQKEILYALNSDVYTVKPKGEKLSFSELAKPYEALNSITFYADESRSTMLNVTQKGSPKGKNIYADPYSGEELGDVVGRDFFMFFFRLHRWLTLSGETQVVGKHIVGVATVAAIILSISGLVIYYPRLRRNTLACLSLDLKAKNRAFLSSLHSVLGVWSSVILLVMSLSGLYWSYGWYRDALFSITGAQKVARGAPAKDAVLDLEALQKAIEIFGKKIEFSEASVRASSSDSTYTISYLRDDSPHFRASNQAVIDVQKGEIISNSLYSEAKLGDRIMRGILPIHSGEYWGVVGQALFFIGSLLMALFGLTGYMLYFKRAKK